MVSSTTAMHAERGQHALGPHGGPAHALANAKMVATMICTEVRGATNAMTDVRNSF